VVVEQPEEPVNPDVHGGRLDHHRIERVQDNPSGINFGTNIAVGDQHTQKYRTIAEAKVRGYCYCC
jgi:hypothetical protein